MNTKNRTVITVSIVLLALTGFFLAQGISQQTTALEENLLKEERHIDTIVDSILRYSLVPYILRIQHIEVAHPEIIEAFANRNREHLYTTTSHEYQLLQQENEYFHAFDFTLPDGTVFLRVQRPDLHGDNITESRKIIQHVQRTQKTAAGFDVGKHGAIYWIAHPLFVKGKYIGTMEFGISAKQLTDAIRKRLQNEVTIAIYAGEWQKAILVQENTLKIGSYYLMTNGKSLYKKFPADVDFNKNHQRVVLNDVTNLIHSRADLNDYSGTSIGKIIVLQDISRKLADKRNFIIKSLLIASILAGTALI
ncbi:MAG: hypothetical protein OEL66_09250, partial [Desulfobulbaceae bacterium]|nr:hypothetical protein [Desulfobulbaceae bacterium]